MRTALGLGSAKRRKELEEKIIPETIAKLKELTGLDHEVVVDWNSIEQPNVDRETVYYHVCYGAKIIIKF